MKRRWFIPGIAAGAIGTLSVGYLLGREEGRKEGRAEGALAAGEASPMVPRGRPPAVTGAANPAPAERSNPRGLAKALSFERIAGTGTLERIKEIRNSPLRPKFELLLEDGSLTTPAIDSVALTPAEAREVEETMRGLKRTAAAAAAQNLIQQGTSERDGVEVEKFRIKPFDFGARFDDQVMALAKSLGRERAGQLLAALPVESLFANFGHFEAIS